ncbi:MAG: PTS lactose/cellobiose transporter subunit IIA, partial [Fusobacteriaceae bacterium]
IEEAEAMIKEAEKAIRQAHYVQTDLIQKEAAGEKMPISMVFIHAQDHLMTAISEKELIKRLIKTNAKLDELTKRMEKLEQK